MNPRSRLAPLLLSAVLAGITGASCAQAGGSGGPVAVDPATDDANGEGLAARGDAGAAPTWARDAEAACRGEASGRADGDRARPGVGAGGGGLWVVDAEGAEAGVLVRRGSDDHVADRAIYDLVTVFHPASGLFYDLTMTAGQVLYPGTTFFTGSHCDVPVGLGSGGCTECRAGFGVGILHGGTWYEVVGGAAFEQTAAGATISSGLAAACVPHSTFNAKAYPIAPVPAGAPTPPTTFATPLRFEWR